MIRFSYLSQLQPPAPFVFVTLRNPVTGVTVEVVASPGEPWVLLGRDVLNHHRILLDGPQLALEIG